MHVRLAVLTSAIVISLTLLVWHYRSAKLASESPVSTSLSPSNTTSNGLPATEGAPAAPASSELSPTAVSAHNLMLRKGPDFRIYVRWLQWAILPFYWYIVLRSFITALERPVSALVIGFIAARLLAGSGVSLQTLRLWTVVTVLGFIILAAVRSLLMASRRT